MRIGERSRAPIALALFLVLAAAGPLAAQERQAALLRQAIDVFSSITEIPDKEIPQAMLKDVAGVAIFPGVRKWGIMVGLQRGQGILVERSGTRWGTPLFVSLSGGTVGWQVGIQSVDLVLFLRTPQSVQRVLEGTLTVGVDAGIAAGSVGRQAGAVTDTSLEAEILTYARSRGFFAGVTLASADIIPDDDANAAFYGRRGVPPADILAGRGIPAPAPVGELRAALERTVRGAP
jgi:lipid-binding SYLF domain-containing protein